LNGRKEFGKCFVVVTNISHKLNLQHAHYAKMTITKYDHCILFKKEKNRRP